MDAENYQSLNDPHLNAYFNNKRIRRHLIKAGLINRQGEILPAPSYEVTLAQRRKRKQIKEKLSHTIANYVIEEERRRELFFRNQFDLAAKRSRVQKIRESKHPNHRSFSHSLAQLTKHPRSRNARTPSPKSEKRSPVRAKSARHPPISVKNQVIRRPTTAKQQSNNDYCEVTMIYFAPPNNVDCKKTWYQPNGDEIVVMQQHCGGENLPVFKGFVKPNEIFTFDSHRHSDYPFALALYINGLIDSRISVCCEYKHKHNVRLGSKYGLFGIYDVKKSQPCRMCRFEQRKKKILAIAPTDVNKPPSRRSVLTTEFPLGALLRTPITSPEKEKEPSKREMNRISTEVQASRTPRTLSPASSHNNDEPNKSSTSDRKKDDSKKSSRVSSSSSKKSGPTSSDILFKDEEPHHSSEPILSKRNNDDDDDDESLNSSRKSTQSPMPFSEDDRHSFKPLPENKNDSYSTRSSSRSSKLSKNEESHHSIEPILSKRNNDDDDDESLKGSRKSVQSPMSFFEDDEDDRHSLKLLPENKNNNHSTRSSSHSSKKSSSSSPIALVKNDDNHIRSSSSLSTASKKSSSSSSITLVKTNDNQIRSRSSSSTTLKRSSSSSSDFFSDKEDDHPASKLLPEEVVTKKQSSRSLSSISATSDSSLENKTDEKLIKEKNLSSGSPTKEIVDHPLLFDKEPDSPKTSESSHHSIKNESESPRSLTSSIKSQPLNEITTQKPVKSDTDLSDDTSSSISIPKRRNEEEEPSSTKSEKTPIRQYRAVENIIVVWLDSTVDNNDSDTRNSKSQLRQIARTLRTFNDPTKCFQLLKEVKNEKIFLVVSGSLVENILEQIDDYSQLVVIYIFCQQKFKYEKLIDQYPKIKGVYTEISTICQRLKIDSKQWDNDSNTFQISPVINNEFQLNSEQLLFIQNQLFKRYLLDIEYDENSINDLVEYCQKLYNENDDELKLIQQFQENYNSNNAIDWYTKDCFAYHILNRAIRMKDIKILFQMGFFIRDIHQQLEENYSSIVHRSTLTLYRGQGMKLEYFEELKENQGGLLSFNGFVSTSKKQNVAYEFAQRSLSNGFPIAVLFRIKIDPKTTSTPFVSLENLSSNPSEYEILLSFKAIFHIKSIEQIENNLWQIDLILTDDISPYIQIEDKKYNHLIDYEKLGELLIEMNELDNAKDLYEINLPDRSNPKYTYIYNQLALIYTKLEAYNQAILFYKLSLQTKSNETLNDYVTISNIHNEIGTIFYKQKKYHEALEKFQEALNIQLEHLSSTDLSLINTYDFIALIYETNEDYQTALEYHQKQLDIQQESSLTKQSDLALTHFKIAICLENLNRLNEAVDHIQKSIDISPPDDSESYDRQAVLERILELIE